ncbi:MAG: hypothetical protein Pg6C_10390 [Treponemataceae bacterium]|nr:MAG: hypothetical protein Pg6C_10390 [Treponemataceae bacterium]
MVSAATIKEVLVSPRQVKANFPMEDIYFECNLKLLFEQVLQKAEQIRYDYYGIFNKENYNQSATNVYSSINEVLRYFSKNKKLWATHEVLPCDKNGSILSRSGNEIKLCRSNMFAALQNYYKTEDAYTKLLKDLLTYQSQNLNLEYNQGKTSPLNAINIPRRRATGYVVL